MGDDALRKHLVKLLTGGEAHITIEDTVARFPISKAGARPCGSPHSAWELLEHLRIAQEDIVRFSGGMDRRRKKTDALPASYVGLQWPDEYWPKSPAPKSAKQWKDCVAAIRHDRDIFLRMIRNPKYDVFEPFPWGDGQTLLRAALLIADHNSYHIGQLLLIRKMIEKKTSKPRRSATAIRPQQISSAKPRTSSILAAE